LSVINATKHAVPSIAAFVTGVIDSNYRVSGDQLFVRVVDTEFDSVDTQARKGVCEIRNGGGFRIVNIESPKFTNSLVQLCRKDNLARNSVPITDNFWREIDWKHAEIRTGDIQKGVTEI
jgi:hypothetical protein